MARIDMTINMLALQKDLEDYRIIKKILDYEEQQI